MRIEEYSEDGQTESRDSDILPPKGLLYPDCFNEASWTHLPPVGHQVVGDWKNKASPEKVDDFSPEHTLIQPHQTLDDHNQYQNYPSRAGCSSHLA